MARTVAGAADVLFVGQADIDPALDAAGGVEILQVGFVLGRQPAPESQQANHHALVGFRRVARDGQRIVAKVGAVEVGELQLGLVDRRFQRHACPPWKAGIISRRPRGSGRAAIMYN